MGSGRVKRDEEDGTGEGEMGAAGVGRTDGGEDRGDGTVECSEDDRGSWEEARRGCRLGRWG